MTRGGTRLRRWLAALCLALAPLPVLAGDALAEARAPIDRLYDALLGVMREADALGFEGRVERLGPVVRDVYDLPFMSAKVLGLEWKRLSEAERQRWLEAFSRLTVSTYADRFEAYSGERFEVLSSEAAAGDTVLVRTRIVPSGEEPVSVDYRLHERDGAWRIVDVYLNGTVSELALRRSEYSSVVKRDGFDALVRSIEQKGADPEGDGSE
jgi:phospholipid transport system substrate-binding protein